MKTWLLVTNTRLSIPVQLLPQSPLVITEKLNVELPIVRSACVLLPTAALSIRIATVSPQETVPAEDVKAPPLSEYSAVVPEILIALPLDMPAIVFVSDVTEEPAVAANFVAKLIVDGVLSACELGSATPSMRIQRTY